MINLWLQNSSQLNYSDSSINQNHAICTQTVVNFETLPDYSLIIMKSVHLEVELCFTCSGFHFRCTSILKRCTFVWCPCNQCVSYDINCKETIHSRYTHNTRTKSLIFWAQSPINKWNLNNTQITIRNRMSLWEQDWSMYTLFGYILVEKSVYISLFLNTVSCAICFIP